MWFTLRIHGSDDVFLRDKNETNLKLAASISVLLAPSLAKAEEINTTIVAGHPAVFRWVKMVDAAFVPGVRAALDGTEHRFEAVSQYGGSIAKVGEELETLVRGLAPLPADARQSITFDRGTEFSAWKHLKAGIGADAWFCDPQAPYQKGTVENTNNRLRKCLPRSTEPTDLKNRYLKSICQILNSTPRKCLG